MSGPRGPEATAQAGPGWVAAPAAGSAASGRVASPGGAEPVAYVVSRFPKLSETFILREVAELERLGQPVEIFSLLRSREATVHPEAAAMLPRVHYRPLFSWATLSGNLVMLAARPGRYLRALGGLVAGYLAAPRILLKALVFFPSHVQLSREIEGRGLRHVHAHFATYPTQAALVAHTLSGVGFSFTAHAHDILIRAHRTRLAEKLRAARFVVTVSRHNREYLLRLVPDMPAEKIRVVRCGLEVDAFQGPSARSHDGPLRLITVARLMPYKGVDDLLRACGRLRADGWDLRCTVVGDGPERSRLSRLIGSLGLTGAVELAGAKPQPEVRRLLAAADIFVLASRVMPDGQTEGIPVSIMEAMATGLPVVATAVSGNPELIEEGRSGLLVPPDDSTALAAAIARLGADAELCRRLGDAARERVARAFRLDVQARLLAEYFRESLGSQA